MERDPEVFYGLMFRGVLMAILRALCFSKLKFWLLRRVHLSVRIDFCWLSAEKPVITTCRFAPTNMASEFFDHLKKACFDSTSSCGWHDMANFPGFWIGCVKPLHEDHTLTPLSFKRKISWTFQNSLGHLQVSCMSFQQLSEGIANMNTDLQDLTGYLPEKSPKAPKFPWDVRIWNL